MITAPKANKMLFFLIFPVVCFAHIGVFLGRKEENVKFCFHLILSPSADLFLSSFPETQALFNSIKDVNFKANPLSEIYFLRAVLCGVERNNNQLEGGRLWSNGRTGVKTNKSFCSISKLLLGVKKTPYGVENPGIFC